ncbi:hypothetical protein E4U43_003595 [Claviceps pusilla]|uniref:Uncharacterized protein n=1 Tax=Claviceps pusilla TaxID=123648 RepID=A0A9P7SWN4_9HYPO|nr:hypothetical protein E4U43_003595 [Claviceps pusilla]
MSTPVAKMVGVSSSRSHNKRLNLGAARQTLDLSASSRTQKLAKCGGLRNHNHGNGRKSSDANIGSSLKISNWRLRQSDESRGDPSSSSARSSFVHVEDELAASASSSASFFPSSTRAGSSARGQAQAQAQAHGRVSRQGSSSSSAFSFEVLRHSRLVERDNGQTVNLFELSRPSRDSSASSKGKEKCTLTPASLGDYSADDALVHMLSRKHTVTPEGNQRQQLLAALCASEATPGRCSDSSLSSFVDALQRLSIQPGPEPEQATSPINNMKPYSTTTRDSVVASSSTTYQNVQNASSSSSSSSSAQPATSSAHAAGGQAEDTRFSKMLDKLHGSVRHEQRPVRQQQGAHEAELAFDVQHRRPMHGLGRRVNTESDYIIEYLPASAGPSSAEYSADFGTTGSSTGSGSGSVGRAGHYDKCNSLNPKAREFLSFTKADSPTAFMPRRPALSSCVFALPKDNGIPVDGMANTLPALYPNYLRAPGLVSHHCPESGTNPTPLNLVPVTLETLNPSRPVVHDVHTKALFPLVPSVPSIAGIPVPCLPMSCGTPGALPVPPRPVPKPKNPDPKTQQEYEAWVEWRKANEPGYAMACKARQQRRVQRKTVQQSKTERANKSV